MKKQLYNKYLLTLLCALLSLSAAYGQTIVGAWQNAPTAACAFQQSTLVLSYTAAENVTGIDGAPTLVGADLISFPSLP